MLKLAVAVVLMTCGMAYMANMVLESAMMLVINFRVLHLKSILLLCMNICFEEKCHHLATWKHPVTIELHMIDYLVMYYRQQVLCTDVQVMRGANCWSDHLMDRAKMRFHLHHREKMPAKLHQIAVRRLPRAQIREVYDEKVMDYLLLEPHDSDVSTEHSWATLKKCTKGSTLLHWSVL